MRHGRVELGTEEEVGGFRRRGLTGMSTRFRRPMSVVRLELPHPCSILSYNDSPSRSFLHPTSLALASHQSQSHALAQPYPMHAHSQAFVGQGSPGENGEKSSVTEMRVRWLNPKLGVPNSYACDLCDIYSD